METLPTGSFQPLQADAGQYGVQSTPPPPFRRTDTPKIEITGTEELCPLSPLSSCDVSLSEWEADFSHPDSSICGDYRGGGGKRRGERAPGKSPSPSRSSPRRHSPVPYASASRHRTPRQSAGSSDPPEDVDAGNLSPRRQPLPSVTSSSTMTRTSSAGGIRRPGSLPLTSTSSSVAEEFVGVTFSPDPFCSPTIATTSDAILAITLTGDHHHVNGITDDSEEDDGEDEHDVDMELEEGSDVELRTIAPSPDIRSSWTLFPGDQDETVVGRVCPMTEDKGRVCPMIDDSDILTKSARPADDLSHSGASTECDTVAGFTCDVSSNDDSLHRKDSFQRVTSDRLSKSENGETVNTGTGSSQQTSVVCHQSEQADVPHDLSHKVGSSVSAETMPRFSNCHEPEARCGDGTEKQQAGAVAMESEDACLSEGELYSSEESSDDDMEDLLPPAALVPAITCFQEGVVTYQADLGRDGEPLTDSGAARCLCSRQSESCVSATVGEPCSHDRRFGEPCSHDRRFGEPCSHDRRFGEPCSCNVGFGEPFETGVTRIFCGHHQTSSVFSHSNRCLCGARHIMSTTDVSGSVVAFQAQGDVGDLGSGSKAVRVEEDEEEGCAAGLEVKGRQAVQRPHCLLANSNSPPLRRASYPTVPPSCAASSACCSRSACSTAETSPSRCLPPQSRRWTPEDFALWRVVGYPPLHFPHGHGVLLVHEALPSPYDPNLPTPPIVLTPHTSYDDLHKHLGSSSNISINNNNIEGEPLVLWEAGRDARDKPVSSECCSHMDGGRDQGDSEGSTAATYYSSSSSSSSKERPDIARSKSFPNLSGEAGRTAARFQEPYQAWPCLGGRQPPCCGSNGSGPEEAPGTGRRNSSCGELISSGRATSTGGPDGAALSWSWDGRGAPLAAATRCRDHDLGLGHGGGCPSQAGPADGSRADVIGRLRQMVARRLSSSQDA